MKEEEEGKVSPSERGLHSSSSSSIKASDLNSQLMGL